MRLNKQVLTSSDVVSIIDGLVKSLAFVQEITIVGRIDEKDLGSPIVPKYTSKVRVVEGEQRTLAEQKLKEYLEML